LVIEKGWVDVLELMVMDVWVVDVVCLVVSMEVWEGGRQEGQAALYIGGSDLRRGGRSALLASAGKTQRDFWLAERPQQLDGSAITAEVAKTT
jgi:hypothetical protein